MLHSLLCSCVKPNTSTTSIVLSKIAEEKKLAGVLPLRLQTSEIMENRGWELA